MPEKTINKANAIGSLFSTWGKIIVAVILFIGGGFTTYYQIQHNGLKNEAQDIEHQLMNERSDKRYKRAMLTADELKKKDEKHDETDIELIKEIYYIKGRIDQMDKSK